MCVCVWCVAGVCVCVCVAVVCGVCVCVRAYVCTHTLHPDLLCPDPNEYTALMSPKEGETASVAVCSSLVTVCVCVCVCVFFLFRTMEESQQAKIHAKTQCPFCEASFRSLGKHLKHCKKRDGRPYDMFLSCNTTKRLSKPSVNTD